MSPQLSIGSLNIDDGEFVLDTEGSKPFALRSVSLRARNVDFGGITGLQLRAYLPRLNGTAALSISGGPHEKQAEILVDQTKEKLAAGRLPELSKEKGVLKAGFQIRMKGNDTYEVKGSGGANQFRWGAESITGQFDSLLELDAKIRELLFSLDIDTSGFPSKLLPIELSLAPGPVRATLRGRYSSPQKTLTVEAMRLASSLGTLEGGGAVALGAKPAGLTATLRLRGLALDSLKPLMPKPLANYAYTGKVAADLKLAGAADEPIVTGLAWSDQAKVQGEKIALSQLSLKIPFQWARSTFQIKAGRVQGKDGIWGREGETRLKFGGAVLVADVVKEQLKPLQMAADFQILEGRFSAAGESKVGEHLNMKGRFACRDCNADASFKGEARIERLELLWNKFFGDFKDQQPSFEIDGSYRRGAEELRFNRFRVALGSIGHLDVEGWVRRFLVDPEFRMEIRTDDLHHAGFYDFFIRDTFKGNYPILGQIGVAGKSGGAIRVEGSLGSFTVEGDLRCEQTEIQEKSGRWRIGAAALDLPLSLRFPQAAKENPGESPRAGKLAIGGIKTLSTTIPKISIPLVLWNNSLRFPEPIRVPLFGGSAVIEGLAWRDVVGAPADLSFSLRLNDLRLLELTEALGWYRFGGTLSGSVPDVHWAGDSLRSSGAITLDVFGGRVTVRGMEMERPFSPLRSVKMDARLEELNLEQASETFAFGRISGVLAGTIEGLVLSQGQPAEFKADIQSVEKPGISQWISVEALDKITILSSGNEAGSIYGVLAEFFDFFRYSKLGFKAALKNDKLVLRGIESREGKDYLVVGTLLPPTVNIVSYTQEIGFSELLERLERVQKNGRSK